MSTETKDSVTMYCDVCGDDRAFSRELRNAVVDVRGEKIAVREPSLLCTQCGAAQPDLTGGVDSIKLANDEYRRRHNLLSGDDIRRIREQYDLSREAFAAVLGMSPATLYRYEAGAIQDEVQDSLIFACDDPAIMERLVQRRRAELAGIQLRRFDAALQTMKLKSTTLSLCDPTDEQLPSRRRNKTTSTAHVGRLCDPLVGFDWSQLYARYNELCDPIDPESIHLHGIYRVHTDPELYSRLLESPRDIDWYEALLYWKLHTNPLACGQTSALSRLQDASCRFSNANRLTRVLEKTPETLPREVERVVSLVRIFDDLELAGTKTKTALPVRTTFLHILYPDVVPIFDKMVLRAVGVEEDGANQKIQRFEEYLPHAWKMADRHGTQARQRYGFRETPLRLVDMALWATRGGISGSGKSLMLNRQQ